MKLKIKLLILALVAVVSGAASFFLFNQKANASLYGPGDVVIDEFTVTGTTWIELINTTVSDINLGASTWQFVVSPEGPPGPSTTTLSGLVPANGMLTISLSTGNPATTHLLLYNNGSLIHQVTYGSPGPGVDVSPPGPGQSAILTGTSTWSVTSLVSKGWFNVTTSTLDCLTPPAPGPGVTPPSLAAIVSCLPAGVTTNMASTSSIPDATAATGLYFNAGGKGEIYYGSTLNLTDQNTRGLLQTLGEKMELAAGKIQLDASTAEMMRNAGATLYFYDLNDLGYNNIGTSTIVVKNDSGVIIPVSSSSYPAMTNVTWSPGNTGTLQFDASHFSEYDINPIVTEVTPVASPAYTATPTYVFSTNVTGTAVYGGDCAMAAASTTNGNNTVVFGPLSDGVHSNCTVKVIDGAGASTTLAVTSFTTLTNPPATPTGLTATPSTSSEIDLAWVAVSGATYYNVYRGTASTSLSVVATTTNIYKNDTGLTYNTLYFYAVSAVNNIGEGASSTQVSTSTLPLAPPGAATATAISSTTASTYVSWTAAANADYYNVYSNTGGGAFPGTYVFVASTTQTNYTHTGLATGTLYFYFIGSVNGGGETMSNQTSAYTKNAFPANLTVTATTSVSVALTWGDNGNPAGTNYSVSTVGASTTTVATSTTLTSLIPNTSYVIYVTTHNQDGTTNTSTVSDYTKSAIPTSPAASGVTDASVDLSWNANSNPGSTIYQISGAGFSTVTTTATSQTISGLTNSTSYTFDIQSQSHDGTLSASASVTTTTLNMSPPNAPINVSDTPTSTSAIIVSWTPPATNTPDYYRVYSATGSLNYQIIGTTTASVYTFTHNGNGPSTKHFYKVASVNDGGETMSDSIVSYTFPNTPTTLAITASSSNSLTVSWSANGNGDNSTDGTQYELYYNGITVTPQSITTTKTISPLNPNTQYSIVVKAQSGKGDKSASSSAVVDWTKPSDPSSLVNTASTTNSLSFSWNANGNPAGTYYVINGDTLSNVFTTSTSYTFSSLTAATTYTTIAVRSLSHEYPPTASYTGGGSTVASASTQANDPASLVTTASSTGSISLAWSENGNGPTAVYQISGSPSYIGSPATTTATSTVISPPPLGLSRNTNYTFTVKTQNPDGSYTAGVSVSDYTKAAAPVSPVVAASSSVNISLTWGANSNPAGTNYQIYGSGFSTTTATTNSATIGSLIPNTQYTFNIRSQNNDGSYTSAVNATDYTEAAIPGTPSATPTSSTQIVLTWAANSNPGTTVYQVAGGPSSPTTTATTLTISGLTPGTSYQFAVRAQNLGDGVWTAYSASSTATSTWSLPTVTSADASSIASTTATFNGNITSIGGNIVTARGFAYGTSTSYGTTSTASGSFGTSTYTASISSLTAGTNYHYKAYATNGAGTGYGSDVMFTSTFAPSSGNPTSTITGGNTATATISVPSSLTNAVVDYTSLTGSNSTTLPGALQVSADTSIGTVQISIPSGTKITAASTWDGTLNLPTVKANNTVTVTPDSGKDATVNTVVEIGFGDVALTLDKAARILIPGYAGKDAGYYRGTTFTKITATCADDTQATNNLLAAGADCKTTSGSDLVIWTKHFTSFIAYTQTNQTTGGSSGSGGTTPPQNVSVTINSAATSTATTAVTLTLTATGATQMLLSNYSDFSVGAWESYATTKSWTLISGVGTKTVYAKFRDASYTTSNAVSDTITLISSTVAEPPAAGSSCPVLASGDMVKVVGKPAIYALNSGLKVLYFPSGDEFKSWRPTYGGYISISQACFDTLSVPTSYPGAVNYRPGSYVVKRPSSSQLYVVEPNNTLAKITPAAATALYGTGYKVMTIADVFWPHYINRGADISTATPHPGMLIKVSNVTYYAGADNILREVTTAGMTANGFQTKFVHTLPGTAIDGWVKSDKMETAISTITNKTQ